MMINSSEFTVTAAPHDIERETIHILNEFAGSRKVKVHLNFRVLWKELKSQ